LFVASTIKLALIRTRSSSFHSSHSDSPLGPAFMSSRHRRARGSNIQPRLGRPDLPLGRSHQFDRLPFDIDQQHCTSARVEPMATAPCRSILNVRRRGSHVEDSHLLSFIQVMDVPASSGHTSWTAWSTSSPEPFPTSPTGTVALDQSVSMNAERCETRSASSIARELGISA